jgi:TM2 domain-containing membrane protein YozV
VAEGEAKPPKDRAKAALYAIFLGGVGAHRFYLGQWRGLAYLLFVWTFVPIVIAVVEAVVFVLTPQARWDAKYNAGRASDRISGAEWIAFGIGCACAAFVLSMPFIAISAMHDFEARARMSDAIVQVGLHRQEIENAAANGEWSGAFKPQAADARRSLKQVYFDEQRRVLVGVLSPIAGQGTIGLAFVKTGEWTCGTMDLDFHVLPPHCRNKLEYGPPPR